TAGIPVALSDFPHPRPRARKTPGADTADVLAELAAAPVVGEQAAGEQAAREPATAPEPGLTQPLSGIRVLDLGLALSGPTCGRILAEFGAEVVKISKPDAGVAGY